MTTGRIAVVDDDTLLEFSFDDMLRYSGPTSPAGVALAYHAMLRALPLLDSQRAVRRREVAVETAFRGPGARDGFEVVTRAVTDGRYRIDLRLERPERGPTLEAFVFRLSYRDLSVTLLARTGVVTDEFVALARIQDRSPDDERRLSQLKAEHALRLVASEPADVFDVDAPTKLGGRDSNSQPNG